MSTKLVNDNKRILDAHTKTKKTFLFIINLSQLIPQISRPHGLRAKSNMQKQSQSHGLKVSFFDFAFHEWCLMLTLTVKVGTLIF